MAVLLRLSLLAVFLIVRCEGTFFNDKNKVTLLKTDWMKTLDESKALSALTIPGTHDSMSSSHQALSLHFQLDAGVRYFEMKASSPLLFNRKKIEIGSKSLDEVLNILKTFLAKYPSEFVLLKLIPEGLRKTETAKGITKVLQKEQGVWLEPTVPTVGQVKGKIVILRSSTYEKGVANQQTSGKKDSKFKDVEKHLKHIKEHLKSAEGLCKQGSLTVTVTSSSAFLTTYKSVAVQVNPNLDQALKGLLEGKTRPSCLGVIATDFLGETLIDTIIKFNGVGSGATVGAGAAQGAGAAEEAGAGTAQGGRAGAAEGAGAAEKQGCAEEPKA